MLHGHAAVGDAVEEGLGPIPCGVEADRPPEGAGAPETNGEDERGEAGGEESDGRFAGVGAVSQAEDGGEQEGGGPEAERIAARCFEGQGEEAGETAGEGEEEEAAEEVLLREADAEEAGGPLDGVTERGGAGEEMAVEDEEMRCGEGEDEQ